MQVPFLDLKRQYQSIKEEIDQVVREVVESGRYIGGEKVENFEKDIAHYVGVKHAIGVSSGTDALLASLMAVGISPGDEVITSPFTFIATAEVVSFLGAKPIFVDIDEETFNINPDLIEKKINSKTKAIIPVHLFGQMAEMDSIMEIAGKYGLKVIEDAAQSIGASYKGRAACSIGDAGCFSFFPSKNLGAFGDGGMVCTNDDAIADTVRQVKEHGSASRYHHTRIGFNGRLDAIQAAVLDVKLRHLDGWTKKRIENSEYYNNNLKELLRVPIKKVDGIHVYNQYSVLSDRRDELTKYLNSRGIPTAIYYPIPLHSQPSFSNLGNGEGDYPVAEKISKKIFSLPIFPELYPEEKEYIIETIREFFK